ncbi:MAG: CBS domain-containing protein [Azospirillum sp.]|nr:CBS domain-containing protein [Azospirillum sp.]
MLETAFSFAIPPFDRLTPAQQDSLRAALDLGFYPKDATILPDRDATECLFVILSGSVVERRGANPVAYYGPRDCFDTKALFGTREPNTFIAAEDTICHLVPRAVITDLARENVPFGDFYTQDIAEKLRLLAREHGNREMAALTMTRLGRATLQAPLIVEPGCTVRSAAGLMKTHHTGSVLVRDGERVGILTGTDMREAVILGGLPVSAPVGPLAHYELIALDQEDALFDALVLMIKHQVRRVVVRNGDAIVGVLEQLDMLSFLSNHSHVISFRVERATSPDDLRQASIDILDLIRTLYTTGVKVGFIADVVTELNRRIFRKLFELLAPPELIENSCLIVMGSEGRAEQILKTDQDNGLILRDGYHCAELPGILDAFSQHLIEFGYPPCPGNIMVSNPDWAKPLSGYLESLRQWLYHPSEEAQLNLAIFYDAVAVAGDPALLVAAKNALIERIGGNDRFFSHFARPTLSFETPAPGLLGSLFGERGSRQHIDLKKAAIFPLVHGIRSLAIELRMTKTNTLDRVWALAETKTIDRAFATELAEGFEFLQRLRLKVRIDGGEPVGATENLIRTDALSMLDRDQLRDCLDLVKRFKEFITYHFHLQLF